MFGHLCWYLASEREGFHPPDETAAQAFEELDGIWTEEYTRNYHAGSLFHLDDVVGFIEMYNIDVESRAEKYAEENDLDVPTARDGTVETPT